MTNQGIQFPKFYVTAASPCPYIEGQEERKVFTELRGPEAAALNEALGKVGFRRSQTVVYRPACENCAECVSVRVLAKEYKPSRSHRRIIKLNSDLKSEVRPPEATEEQYELLTRYLGDRHAEGSMAGMTFEEFSDMMGSSPVQTVAIEYRKTLSNELVAVALTDEMSDGLSMVYSFFDTVEDKRSIGTYLICDHIERSRNANQPHVYLGYYVEGSPKMSYKARFKPLERLGPNGWYNFDSAPEQVST